MDLFDLPVEILDQIWSYLETTFEHCYWDSPDNVAVINAKNFQRLSLISRTAFKIALPLRYGKLTFEHGQWFQRFQKYIPRQPSRAPLVKKISLDYRHSDDFPSVKLDWKLFVNLRELRILDPRILSSTQGLSPTGESFPSLEFCQLNLQLRRNVYLASTPQFSISDLMPFWGAPRLQHLEIEGGNLVGGKLETRHHFPHSRSTLASLSLAGILLHGSTIWQELFTIRRTRHLSLRSVYTEDRHFVAISELPYPQLRDLDCSAQAQHVEPAREPDLHLMDELRSLQIDILHLVPPKTAKKLPTTITYSLDEFVAPPLPEYLKRIQVNIRTYWLRREEAYRALLSLIDAWSKKGIELQIRLMQRGDLRCLGNAAVENPLDQILVGEGSWRFTIVQMQELQRASEGVSLHFEAENIWLRDAEENFAYLYHITI